MLIKSSLFALLLICNRVKPSRSDTLIVPIKDSDEAWEITSYGNRVVNTWRSNYDMCSSRGAMLLEIHDKYMTEQVRKFAGNKGVWLGLLFSNDRKYSWASGADLGFTNWAHGYPITGHDAFYAVLSADGRWRTTKSSADLGAVCMRRITRPRSGAVSMETEEKSERGGLIASRDLSAERGEANAAEYKPKIYLDGIVLHIAEEPTDWLNAYYFCKRKDLALAVILTADFNAKLTRVARELKQPIWLSLVGAGGRFWWMNGVQFEYSELSPDYDLTGRDSTYTLLKEDGKWHDSCPGGIEPCQQGLPLCVEISPESTAQPAESVDSGITTTYFTEGQDQELTGEYIFEEVTGEFQVSDEYTVTGSSTPPPVKLTFPRNLVTEEPALTVDSVPDSVKSQYYGPEAPEGFASAKHEEIVRETEKPEINDQFPQRIDEKGTLAAIAATEATAYFILKA